ncbi:MAG: 50S ribosomal protein L11 methyltransferase [bacterium]
MTDWTEFVVVTPSEGLDKVEDALLEAGAVAVTLQDAEDQPVLEPLPGEHPVWDRVRAKGLFDKSLSQDEILLALESALPEQLLKQGKLEFLPDQNWIRSWMDHYEPIVFGDLCICPEGMEAPAVENVVTLDPGLAFGTGTHPTTALCIEWLSRHGQNHSSCLDFGCGSGILALCAAKKGVKNLVAVDIDPQAIVASNENAIKNQVKMTTGLPEILKGETYDLVLANILAGPLVELAEKLAFHTSSGGTIVLSGLLETQQSEVVKAYQRWFESFDIQVSDGWLRVSARRKN